MLVPRWATQSQHWPAVCCLTRHLYACVCGHPLCVHVFSVHLCCGNVFTHTHTHLMGSAYCFHGKVMDGWDAHVRTCRALRGRKREQTQTCSIVLSFFNTQSALEKKPLSRPFAPFVQEFSWVQMNAWATDGAADQQQQQLSVWRPAESSAAAGCGGNAQVTSQLVQQRCNMLPPVKNVFLNFFFFFDECIQMLSAFHFRSDSSSINHVFKAFPSIPSMQPFCTQFAESYDSFCFFKAHKQQHNILEWSILLKIDKGVEVFGSTPAPEVPLGPDLHQISRQFYVVAKWWNDIGTFLNIRFGSNFISKG